MVQYSMKMHQIVTTRLNNLQYHSLLRLNSIDINCMTFILGDRCQLKITKCTMYVSTVNSFICTRCLHPTPVGETHTIYLCWHQAMFWMGTIFLLPIYRSMYLNKGTTINDLGGGGNFRHEFIFSRGPLPYKKDFLGKASQNFFFPRQGISKFIFFLESASQNLFFSWRVPLKKYFFPGDGPSKYFFSISSGPLPRSLMVVP